MESSFLSPKGTEKGLTLADQSKQSHQGLMRTLEDALLFETIEKKQKMVEWMGWW